MQPDPLTIPQLPEPFLVISGNGRSGSNRLLDILDHSPFTVCRNEPNTPSGGQLNGIGGLLFDEDLTPQKRTQLDQAILAARFRRSERDRPPKAAKAHFKPHWLSNAVHWGSSKNRLRNAVGETPLLTNPNEWPMSGLYLDKAALKQALLILKINAGPAWVRYLHNRAPNALFIHNIRHPRDYLNSWYNRFAKTANQALFEKFFHEVGPILAHYGRDDAERLRDFSIESLVEIEIWRWRYTNEQLQTTLTDTDRAIVVTYNDVSFEPEETARRVYNFAGLEFSDALALQINQMRNTLFAKKHTSQLENQTIDKLTKKVLSGSPLFNIKNLF